MKHEHIICIYTTDNRPPYVKTPRAKKWKRGTNWKPNEGMKKRKIVPFPTTWAYYECVTIDLTLSAKSCMYNATVSLVLHRGCKNRIFFFVIFNHIPDLEKNLRQKNIYIGKYISNIRNII